MVKYTKLFIIKIDIVIYKNNKALKFERKFSQYFEEDLKLFLL